MRVFLVEDDEVYAEFIKKALADRDYNVESFITAEDCKSALNGNLPEVFIIDYKLPGMSGIQLFEELKPSITDDVKVIILSSIDDGNLVLEFIKKGIRDYVVKDEYVIDSLEAIIEGRDDDYYFFDD